MPINFYTDESVVFPTVQGVAVYKNDHGDIVLAQEGLLGGDESFVYIPIIHVASVIRAMEKIAAEANGDGNEVV